MPIRRNSKLVSNEELQAFFDDFERRTEVTEEGLSFPSFAAINHQEEILPDAFTITPALGRSAAIRLFSKALHDARRAGPLSANALIERAEQIHRADRAVPLQTFTLWTKIRARSMQDAQGFRIDWGDVSIRTAANLPKWLHLEGFDHSSVGSVDPSRPTSSGYVIIRCQERRDEDAVDRMLDALHLLMGLINLYETRGRWTIMAGNRWTAGKLWLGPYQFVFRGRKFIGSDSVWYNPNYDEEGWEQHLPPITDFLKVIPNVNRALTALASHPFKSILVTALQLMQDAFETRDGNHRLLRFWAALEKLYVEDWSRDRSNQKVIDRATFADSDRRLTKWQLSHIARVRNEYVHARGHGDELMHLGQTLRDLLTRHILHWIFRGDDFPDHQALLAYVDLPRDDEALIALRNAVDRRLELNRQREK